ncbi:MAG: DUF2935 domain-containing protein [Clostridiaceae bacterium]
MKSVNYSVRRGTITRADKGNFTISAEGFINLFDNLLEKSHKSALAEDLSELNCEAYSAASKIRDFKLTILSKQLEEKISINLPPTFINHMINELDEYIMILNTLIMGNAPSARDIHLHLLWLSDGAGHASTIASNLDVTQKELIKKSKEYSKVFTDLYLRSIEYNGYTRTAILEKKVLGTLSPLVTDHMFREECYYLTKLSMVSDTNDPGCNPAKPRIET